MEYLEEAYELGNIPRSLTNTFQLLQHGGRPRYKTKPKRFYGQYTELDDLRVARIGREGRFETLIFYDPEIKQLGWERQEKTRERGFEFDNYSWSRYQEIPGYWADDLKELGLLESD